jgi:2-C-methyl-D-erythritol 4-phosphate cytidylyltransferase
MHKDCIILAYQLSMNHISILETILKFLQTEHFCKIVFAISDEQTEVEQWLLHNYSQFGIAIDIYKGEKNMQSGEAIWHALPYCDTDDVMVINPLHFIPFHIIELLSAQILKQADATIVLPANHTIQLSNDLEIETGLALPSDFTWGTMIIYKMSFLTNNYPKSFNIIEDFLQKHKENKQHIFAFIGY